MPKGFGEGTLPVRVGSLGEQYPGRCWCLLGALNWCRDPEEVVLSLEGVVSRLKLWTGIVVAPFLVEGQCAVSRYVARDGSVVNYWKTAMCGRCSVVNGAVELGKELRLV